MTCCECDRLKLFLALRGQADPRVRCGACVELLTCRVQELEAARILRRRGLPQPDERAK